MDPMTMMAFANLGSQIIGQKQIGGMAPAYQPGAPAQVGGGLLGGNYPSQQMSDFLSTLPQSPAAPVRATPDVQGDPVAESLKQQSLADIDNGPEKPGGFGSFLSGLDRGLQSPSQMLGLGLLSRLTNQNPYAGLGGLLAMGLYNRNK